MTRPPHHPWIHRIDRALLWIAGIALVGMMLHICVDVVANTVLGTPVPLTNAAVTQYYMIAVAYLPMAAAELRGAHVSVDLVVNQFPARLRRTLGMLMQVVCMLIYGALAAQAWQLALEKLERNAFLMEQTSRVSTWPSYFLIPLGFATVTALLLAKMILTWLGKPPVTMDDGAEQEGSRV
jgi:TRAP-type C4-dicarboxylate transport system permease small subunit